jgi:uncharacterized protein
MTERYHAIPRDLFDALAAGGGGPEAIGVLAAAERSKHATLLRGVLAAAQRTDADQARRARISWEVLDEVDRHNQDAAARVMTYPAVGAWAVRILGALDPDGRVPEPASARLAGLAEVAAAAAIRSGLEVEVPVRPISGVVSLPSLGAARVDADSALVSSGDGQAEIRWAGGRVEIPSDTHRDAPGWLGLRSIQAGDLALVIDDLHPFRMPAVTGLAPRLSAQEAGDWQRSAEAGWRVLAVGHPSIAAEVAAAISVIVPLSRPDHGQVSSSSPEAFGAVAMSEPADPDTCASAFTHEVQHLKLCAVVGIVSLTRPDDGRRYYAPWRADPRPVAGLLQGAYAYLGVTEFWRRQRQLATGAAQQRADGEFALWRVGTARVIDALLSSDRLTPAGTDFVQGMLGTASGWAAEPVSVQARAFGADTASSHLAQWGLDHGPVPA